MKKRAKLFLLFLSIVGLNLQSCQEKKSTQTELVAALPVAKVKVSKAGVSEQARQYKFSAKIEAEQKSNLSTRMMGEIISLKVKEGQRVQKGQVIARIKSTDIQAKKNQLSANVLEIKAGLTSAEADYNRIKSLFDKKSATQKELDDITAHRDMLRAKIKNIEYADSEVNAILDYATVKAPFSGVIIKKMMNEGDIASPGMPILSIQGTGVFKAVAKVPESEISLFKEGSEVQVKIDALGDKMVSGIVSQVNPSGGYSGAQYELNIMLKAEKNVVKELKNGMFASVILENGSEKHILVPTKAIVRKGQLQGLFTTDAQGKAMLRWLRFGKQFGDKIEVLSGLSEGENYIISHEGKLVNGQKTSAVNK
jgi:RND family efflux transporter MFP subunit